MQIAVIVPTLNEEATLPRVLGMVEQQLRGDDFVVVVDGGSSDRTLERASGSTVLQTEPGRGQQLDYGARHAIEMGAELLVFIHADSVVPLELLDRLRRLRPKIGGGCLIEFVNAGRVLKWGERLVNWRTKRFKRPLGDQIQFATVSAYQEVQGFPHWPILEDTEFVDRLRRLGPIEILEVRVGTSIRRFRARGTLRTVVTNWLIWTLHRLGLKPARLARLYRNIR